MIQSEICIAVYAADSKMKREESLIFRGVTLHSPLVSVVLVTRQHADTLRTRLDSILSQYTTFDMEVVIIDRGSSDETGDICQEYKALYPGKVRFYMRTPGDFPEKSRIIQLKGDFGIICNDNDLWSNIFKLQHQGLFLMNHPEYDLCFHNVQGSYALHLCARDYLPGEISPENLFRSYSPLFRLSGRHSAHHFLLYEKIGGDIFTRYSFRGKMRCLGNVYSEIIPNALPKRRANLPFSRNYCDR